jgi:hypothetical protein
MDSNRGVNPVITPQIGDRVHLGTVLANVHMFGVLSDGDTPDQVSATLELFGGNGTLSLAALMGPPGPPGRNAPILKLQSDNIVVVDDLPTNLTNDPADIGKYWIIEERDDLGNVLGSKAYLWHGTHWQVFQMGTQGPPGPVPIITPNVELLDPDDPDVDSYITVTGTDTLPNWTMYLKSPRGPRGPATSIAAAPDVNGNMVPQTGDVLTFNEKTDLWEPRPASEIGQRFFTMPEAAFNSVSGLQASVSVPIGSYALPPQDFPWTPIVFGHMRIRGMEADADPMIFAIEVLLGDPKNGKVVAKGWGNVSTWTTVVPHFSTQSAPGDAVTPDNGLARVRANHTGNEGTLYVRILNNGVLGLPALIEFKRDGAQLSIQVQPV